MSGFPLLLDVRGRRVVVVGAGSVGTRRAAALRDAGADVAVITSDEAFEPADLDGAWLAFACTDDPQVNAAVAAAAEDRRVFCVRADAATGGTARTPAVARLDGITVAVNGGDDPGRAVTLRDAIATALAVGDLPTRRHRRPTRGSVALVGGGPGDPELITVRARRLVADADVVVVDRLAPRALLEELAPDVEVIDCGKSAHRHNLTQAQINEVLVARARAGKRVVRLKGGDPFVFGRGSEEAAACCAARVPVHVVPGVSSAVAAPAVVGIPVTARGLARSFTVVTGHTEDGALPDVEAFAAADTLVVLMGLASLGALAARLIAAGRDPATPAACIQSATTPEQRVTRGTLATIAESVQRDGLVNPVVTVIGAVAALGVAELEAVRGVALAG